MPGVSRSGATIVGAMLMGVEKRVAAEFSFLLAIPVMAGAFTVDAWKNRHDLANMGHLGLVAVGFVVSFVVALVVIRAMLAIVTRRGYAPFGWLRIVIGGGRPWLLSSARWSAALAAPWLRAQIAASSRSSWSAYWPPLR